MPLIYNFIADSAHSYIHQIFENHARHTPEAPALVFEGQKVSYAQLDFRANQLAHYLQAAGVGPDVLVGIYLERSIELIVAMLGVLKAGGAFLPLDPAYPSGRVGFMLADAKAKHLLTVQVLLPHVAHHGINTVCLDADGGSISQFLGTVPASALTPDSLAYVIYTSGSTGTPKGVMVPHKGLPNVAVGQQQLFQVGPGDRVLQLASSSFDAAVAEIMQALCSGAALYLGRQEDLMPGAGFVQLLRENQITVMTMTPSALAACPPADLPDLRVLNVAGEACPAFLVEQWANGRHFFNLYGPTEATIWTTSMPCTPSRQPPPIGKPAPNTAVYLLDANLEQAAKGESGEIFIGGIGVTRGYLGRPRLTAERFLPDPFSDQPGQRLYRTGDLARCNEDGNLEYLGRRDRQVKVRGFRIELGEIESLLEQHPLVRQAVALVREDEPGEKRLVAYLVPRTAVRPTIVELRSYVQSKLPHYMVPGAFVFLEAFPMTPNGKLDLQALPQPDTLRPDIATPYRPPESALEKELSPIWAEVLGIDRVGVNDNFFELGGHSLGLTQVIARVREIFHVELPLASVFENPTIADFARQVQAAGDSGPSALPPIKPVPRTGPLPLSFSQERIWFIKELAPENLAYNAQSTIHFQGQLNIPVLEQALTELVRRHEMLRTSFLPVNGRLMQVFHDPWPVEVPVIGLSHIPQDEREPVVQQHIREAFQYVFDTTKIPLIRWTLLRLDEENHILIQVEHHFIHDGWSFAVIARELKALYAAFLQGRPSPLPEPVIQFADFAVWQREWLQGETLDKQLAYWKAHLAGELPTLQLPTDRPFPPVPTFKGASVRTEFDPAMYEALRQFSRREGVTLFITLLSAFNALLSRYSGQEDIVIGTSVANRRLQESENLIGMIVNNLVLRTNLEGNPTFREMMKRAQRVAVGAFDHQDVPFERLVNAVQPERDLSRNPLFQVVINFHDAPVPLIEMPGVVGKVEYHQNDSAKFDLNVLVIPRAEQQMGRESAENRLTVIWEYNKDIFEAETVARMAERFQTILAGVTADPQQRLSELPLLTAAEQETILSRWNETATAYPRQQTIHQLFEAQAAQTPDATALVFQNQQLTYRQLNERANQVAHLLQAVGVRPNQLVGLALERSLEMIVATLGILKAGAAYLPLDPAYPPERLAFMLQDTGAAVILTQQSIKERLPAVEKLICLDSEWHLAAQHSSANPEAAVSPQHLAYVIYTSGSTGRPKGVSVTHRNVVRLVKDTNYLPFTPDEIFLQFAPISFDAATLEIWGSLLNGAQLVIFPPHMPSLAELGRVLRQHRVTTLWLTAGLFHLMVEEHLDDLRSLRYLLAGGDVLSVGHVKRVLNALPGCRLINGYGPTESTTFTTCYPMTSAADVGNTVFIGRPIANTTVYILDKRGQPVPAGIPGELYIGGDGLAQGYFNRPALTAEKFVPHPFAAEPGARLYRTGDLVRYLADGRIEFMGRIDEQVKIRGFRIEPGEIETTIAQHPAVQEATVVVHKDSAANKHLAAYIVLRPEREAALSALRDFLRDRLPDYMMPAWIVPLEAMPLTPNGKIDRRALPKPDLSAAAGRREFVPAATDAEMLVVDIWADVLNVERIGIYDNFFELGGHSLLAVQALSQIRSALEIELSIRDFFNNPTVADFAALVERIITAELDALDEAGFDAIEPHELVKAGG